MTLYLPTTVDAVRAELTSGNPRGYSALSDLMEFDHPITIHPDGRITDGPRDLYAPDLYDDELSGDRWELLNGYSGQHGYSGPIMHDSEFIGGGMARDILDTPGTYVAIASYYSPDEIDADDIPDDFPVRPVHVDDDELPGPGIVTDGTCGLSWDDTISTAYTPAPSARCPFEEFHPDETVIEGWAVARLVEDAEAPVLAHEAERYNA